MEGNSKRRRHTESSNTPPKYTKEQCEVVQNILKCKDNYYEVLSLTKSCTDDELRKAYKKLSLIVHPDKNNAPGATEACKAVNKAYYTLIDPNERQLHDESKNERYATRMPQPTTNSGPSSQSHQQNAAQNQQQTENLFTVLLNILAAVPLVAAGLFLLWLLEEDPAYSLQQNSKYIIKRTTRRLSLPYFVKRDFLRCHGDKIAQIEQQVEEKFLDFLDQVEEE